MTSPSPIPENPPREEPDTDNEVKPRRKGIYLLPNLLTTGCLFAGFYAIVAAIGKHFALAGMGVRFGSTHTQIICDGDRYVVRVITKGEPLYIAVRV